MVTFDELLKGCGYRALKELGIMIREGILAVPKRTRALLAAETDPLKCDIMLTKELTIAISEISNFYARTLGEQ